MANESNKEGLAQRRSVQDLEAAQEAKKIDLAEKKLGLEERELEVKSKPKASRNWTVADRITGDTETKEPFDTTTGMYRSEIEAQQKERQSIQSHLEKNAAKGDAKAIKLLAEMKGQ